MPFYNGKINEIAGLFQGELKLAVKSTKSLNSHDILVIGRSSVDNPSYQSDGIELVYRTQSMSSGLVVYAILHRKTNSSGRPYPHDLIVAADFETGRLDDVFDAYTEGNVRPFLFVDSIPDSIKRRRFDRIFGLNEGSHLKELADILDAHPARL